MPKDKKLNIRRAGANDIPLLTSLSEELGYPTSEADIKKRLSELSSDPKNGIFVAEYEFIVGWIHISITQSLQSKSFAEIRGLVVSESHRNVGIGTQLVLAAENWAKDQNHNKIRVRTNVVRKQTITFYKKLGYKTSKTQKVFDKSFQPAG